MQKIKKASMTTSRTDDSVWKVQIRLEQSLEVYTGTILLHVMKTKYSSGYWSVLVSYWSCFFVEKTEKRVKTLNAINEAKRQGLFRFRQCFISKSPHRQHWSKWKHTRKSNHIWTSRGFFLEENTSWVMGGGQVWVGILWWKPDSLGISPDLYRFFEE